MEEKLCFVAVEFEDDPNVKGLKYWYVCPFTGVAQGDYVLAPLGRHNKIQCGVVREVRFEYERNSPYPIYLIKYIKSLQDSRQGSCNDV